MNVSVVIATCGDRRWLELAEQRAAPSCLGQGALEVLQIHEDAMTVAQVRNYAASFARGDALVFLDADDELAPGYLDAMRPWFSSSVIASRVVPAMSEGHTPPHLLVPSIQYVREDGTATDPEIPAWGRPLIDINCAVVGTAVSRALFMKAGWFAEEPIYEDWALWLRCLRAGAVMAAVPAAVYRAHVNPDSRNRQLGPAVGSTYQAIRQRHLRDRDWDDLSAYKVGP